jgi:ANTAR domain
MMRALASRDRIGLAKGILMERHRLAEDEAFWLLIEVSQQTNIKVRHLAEQLAQHRSWAPGTRTVVRRILRDRQRRSGDWEISSTG